MTYTFGFLTENRTGAVGVTGGDSSGLKMKARHGGVFLESERVFFHTGKMPCCRQGVFCAESVSF
jgi:hypothetical protein